MRKVKFKKWMPTLWDLNAHNPEAKPMYSETPPDRQLYPYQVIMKSAGYEEDFNSEGYFHCFASLQQTPLAVIEDMEGKLHQVQTDQFIFIDSPDLDVEIKITAPAVDEALEYGLKDYKGRNSFYKEIPNSGNGV